MPTEPSTPVRARRRKRASQGTAWPSAIAAAPAPTAELGPVGRETLAAVMSLRDELGREPTPLEVGARIGLPPALAAEHMNRLPGRPSVKLTKKQRQCLEAIIALEQRLGRSPSTLEVSAEMGLCPSGSRFHINGLAKLGLVTPPAMILVLTVTPAGKAAL